MSAAESWPRRLLTLLVDDLVLFHEIRMSERKKDEEVCLEKQLTLGIKSQDSKRDGICPWIILSNYTGKPS